MTSIPDAAIEAAAEALRNGPVMQGFNDIARAAIEAAMPAIREHIARGIETAKSDLDPYSDGWKDQKRGYGAGIRYAARIVRGES